jgi:hypothetical protein
MSAVSSNPALKANTSGHTRRYIAVGVLAALSLFVPRAAYAFQIYAYYAAFANPTVPHSSDGWNNRDHNRVCRDDATYLGGGLVRAADYNGAGVKVEDTSPQWSQCQTGLIVRIETDGYFLTRCWNSDSIGMILYCQTTRP